MNCHLLLFLGFMGAMLGLIGAVVCLSIVCAWLEMKFGTWAAWIFVGCVVTVCLAGVAWYTPCPL